MKFKYLPVLMIIAFLSSCEDEPFANTDKSTFYDDMADITVLNGYFYSTNHDLSGHAGSQIDLLKFEMNGADIFLSDRYALEINGQGYMAITNDGSNLFLQSHDTQLIMKYSSVGERGFLGYDELSTSWLPAGLAYNPDTDSLLTLHRNSQNLNEFRLRSISKDSLDKPSRDEIFQLEFMERAYHGVYAMEYHDSLFYILGVDSIHQDLLLILDNSLSLVSMDTLSDTSVVGLCFKNSDLFLSHADKRIEWFATY